MLKRIVIAGVVGLALLGAVSARPAAAGVSIGINLVAPPSLVIVPGTPVAYAPAVPANYFYYGGQYYVWNNGWFVGRGYNGPWFAVAPAYVPRPLLTVPVRYYRAAPAPWHRWNRQGPPHWAPAYGYDWRGHHPGPPRRGPVDHGGGHGDHGGHDRDHHGGPDRNHR